MPHGVYTRTDVHKKICSDAGKASAQSPVNKARHAAKRETVNCKGCGEPFELQKCRVGKIVYCPNCSPPQRPWEELSYGSKHYRIKKLYGTPSLCEVCGCTDSKKFEWANVSGEYKEDRSDWIRLCCKCHRTKDFGGKTPLSETHREATIRHTKRGVEHGNAKLTEADVKELRRRWGDGETGDTLARAFKISRSTVSQIVKRKTWKEID